MNIVFDLDGTLADNKHREHFVTGKEKDWDAFFGACDDDAPIWPAIDVLMALQQAIGADGYRHCVEIWSGRGQGENNGVREKTLRWLSHITKGALTLRINPLSTFFYADNVIDLRMRAHCDYTPDNELKKIWLDESREQGRVPDLVFDDRQKVVDMWRSEGIPCFQVAPGDF